MIFNYLPLTSIAIFLFCEVGCSDAANFYLAKLIKNDNKNSKNQLFNIEPFSYYIVFKEKLASPPFSPYNVLHRNVTEIYAPTHGAFFCPNETQS